MQRSAQATACRGRAALTPLQVFASKSMVKLRSVIWPSRRCPFAQSQGGCDAALFDKRNGTACCGLVFRCRIAAGSRLALPAPVLVDLLLQIVELLARQQADLLQRLQMRFGLGQLADHQVGLADIFVGAAMARIEL